LIYVYLPFRLPFLLDILVTIATGRTELPGEKHMGPFALVYSILMFMRNSHLSALQRVLTLVVVKGAVNEQV